MRSFKQKFREAMSKVCAAWPEIKVVCGRNGLTVLPCGSSLNSKREHDFDANDAAEVDASEGNPF